MISPRYTCTQPPANSSFSPGNGNNFPEEAAPAVFFIRVPLLDILISPFPPGLLISAELNYNSGISQFKTFRTHFSPGPGSRNSVTLHSAEVTWDGKTGHSNGRPLASITRTTPKRFACVTAELPRLGLRTRSNFLLPRNPPALWTWLDGFSVNNWTSDKSINKKHA